MPSATVTNTGSVGGTKPFPDAPSFVDVASSNNELSTFLSVLQQERLAPNNQAFEDFLSTENGQRFQDDDEYVTALLEYHTILGVIEAARFSGDGFLASEWYRTFYYRPEETPRVDVRVGGYTGEDGPVKVVGGYLNTATVQQANVESRGGYVHVIDSVLTVPPNLQDLLVAGGFISLLGALELAGLNLSTVEQLDQPTVFAPTNEAFQNIGSILGSLSAEDVSNILMYHVVDMPAFVSDLTDGQELQTLARESVMVTIRDRADGPLVFVNGAMVTQPNLVLATGVVHGLD